MVTLSPTCRRGRYWLPLYLGFIFVCGAARGDDYPDFAALIAKPLHPSAREAREAYRDEAVMLRLVMGRRVLRDMNTENLPEPLRKIHARALAELEAAHASLAAIRQLNNATPDFSGIVDRSLAASPALLRNYQDQQQLPGDQAAINQLLAKGLQEVFQAGANHWQLAEERNSYRSHYAELGSISLELAAFAKQRPCLYGLGIIYDVTDAGPQSSVRVARLVSGGSAERAGLRSGDRITSIGGLPIITPAGLNQQALRLLEPAAEGTTVKVSVDRVGKTLDVALKRTLPLNNVSDLLQLRLTGSCDGVLDSDTLSLTNDSDVDLANCTLLVTLQTDDDADREQARQHLHFVKHWPKEETFVATYRNDASTGIARSESFPCIKRVSVQLYADQFQGLTRYSYWNSEDRKRDLKRYCEQDVAFRAKYIPETDGLIGTGDGLYRSDAGVRIWLCQVAGKALPHLTPREIQIVLHRGGESVTATFAELDWQGASVTPFKTFLSKEFNALREPDRYEVRLRFDGTDFEHMLRFEN